MEAAINKEFRSILIYSQVFDVNVITGGAGNSLDDSDSPSLSESFTFFTKFFFFVSYHCLNLNHLLPRPFLLLIWQPCNHVQQ